MREIGKETRMNLRDTVGSFLISQNISFLILLIPFQSPCDISALLEI